MSTRRSKKALLSMARVAEKMVHNLDLGRSEERRNCGYDLATQTFPKAQALRYYQDLALTIGVHPSACGMHSAGNGLFIIPEGYKLRMH